MLWHFGGHYLSLQELLAPTEQEHMAQTTQQYGIIFKIIQT